MSASLRSATVLWVSAFLAMVALSLLSFSPSAEALGNSSVTVTPTTNATSTVSIGSSAVNNANVTQTAGGGQVNQSSSGNSSAVNAVTSSIINRARTRIRIFSQAF